MKTLSSSRSNYMTYKIIDHQNAFRRQGIVGECDKVPFVVGYSLICKDKKIFVMTRNKFHVSRRDEKLVLILNLMSFPSQSCAKRVGLPLSSINAQRWTYGVAVTSVKSCKKKKSKSINFTRRRRKPGPLTIRPMLFPAINLDLIHKVAVMKDSCTVSGSLTSTKELLPTYLPPK